MSIIPVIDLKGGFVVRGVAGQRSEYRPVESVLATDAKPETVATAFVSQFGCRDVYVADLDAIAGAPPNLSAYDAIEAAGLRLLIDCGISTPRQCRRWFPETSRTIVVGLETVRAEHDLTDVVSMLGPERVVFSLDLKAGRPLTSVERWLRSPPHEIADDAIAAGFKRLIVLDLARVGVGEGPSVAPLCEHMRRRHSSIELIAGGGVRQISDVQRLIDAGCDRVLVASALHNANITGDELSQFA